MKDSRTQRKANTDKRKSKPVSLFFVRLPADIKSGLERISEFEDRTMSSVARRALREYVEKHPVMRPEPVGVGVEAR